MNKFISVIIVCVNYSSYKKSINYINSLIKAYIYSNLDFKLDILIADNSDKFNAIQLPSPVNVRIIHKWNKKNYGYIGGVKSALINARIDIKNYDFFIISNVDLEVDKTFFLSLLNFKDKESKIGWIVPSIFSLKENRDKNPRMLHRPSRLKMYYGIILYRFSILYYIYKNFIYNRKIRNTKKHSFPLTIYAGHGSIMIFTHLFIKNTIDLNFPAFLFGEEIYFGELVRLSNLKVVYIPNIVVYDFENESTGKLNSRELRYMQYISLKKLKDKFF